MSDAITNAAGGDIINLKSGTYSAIHDIAILEPHNSGSAGNVITFQTAPNETIAVVQLPTSTYNNEAAAAINNKSYIKINRIKFYAAPGAANRGQGIRIIYGSTYNEISNCQIEGFVTGIQLHSRASGYVDWIPSQHNWIHGNTIQKIGDAGGPTCVHSGYAISIGFDDVNDQSWYNTVEDNVIYYGGHDTLNLMSTKYQVVRNNVAHNDEAFFADGGCKNTASGYLGNRNFLHEAQGDGSEGRVLFEGNRLGYAGVPPDHNSASGLEIAAPYNILRYNFLYGNKAMGIYGKSQGLGYIHNRWYNNTVYSNGGSAEIDSQFRHGIYFSCGLTFPADDVVVKNNLLYGNVDSDAIPDPTSEYCTNFVLTPNLLNTDPTFLDVNMDDKTSTTRPSLAIGSGSAAKDQATYLTTATPAGNASTSLVVVDSLYFQAGNNAATSPMGSKLSNVQGDWVAVGTVGNVAQITDINYTTNTLTITPALTWANNAPVWLYKKSDGTRVLYGTAPDYGAYEYGGGVGEAPPAISGGLCINCQVIQ